MMDKEETKKHNYTAQEKLLIRGAWNYLIFVSLIGFSSVTLQLVSRLPLKNILVTFIFAATLVVFAYYIYTQNKIRRDPILACWLVGIISILAPIVVKYSYTRTMDWTYAAQSYHASAITFALLIMLQFLRKKVLFIVCSIIVFGNWILFMLLAAKNGATIHFNSFPNGVLIHDGVLLTREISFFLIGAILAYSGYRNISVISKYDHETVSQHKIIEDQKIKLEEYAAVLEEKVALRTVELQAAIEELQTTNDQLSIARDSLWGEMQLANKIQTILLPRDPAIKGHKISAYMKTTEQVGGDYYDIINTNKRDWIVIGDVSGHGVSSGLIMMMMQTCIRSHIEINPSIKPSDLLEIANKTISHNIELMNEKKFMTITAIAIDKYGDCIFSGRHEDILVYRNENKTVESIVTDGICISPFPLGKKDVNKEFKLNKDDVLLVYTDGIIESVKIIYDKEAKQVDLEMFGIERLIKLFKENGHKDIDDVKKVILEGIGGFETNDDITMVIYKNIVS